MDIKKEYKIELSHEKDTQKSNERVPEELGSDSSDYDSFKCVVEWG